VKGQLDEKGRVKKDKEDRFMKEERGKKLYKNWAKKNVISLQKEGEIEDSTLTNKAKALFNNRVRRLAGNNEEIGNRNGKFERNNRDKNQRSKKIKKELRSPAQILKVNFQKEFNWRIFYH
jgi:hypothetical protein